MSSRLADLDAGPFDSTSLALVAAGGILSGMVLLGSATLFRSSETFLLGVVTCLVATLVAAGRLEGTTEVRTRGTKRETCGCPKTEREYAEVGPTGRQRVVGWFSAGVGAFAGVLTVGMLLV